MRGQRLSDLASVSACCWLSRALLRMDVSRSFPMIWGEKEGRGGFLITSLPGSVEMLTQSGEDRARRSTDWDSACALDRGESNSKEMESFPGWRGLRTTLRTQLQGAYLRPRLHPTPPVPVPSMYHITEDALLGNVLLKPSGSLASGLLSPQPAWCAGR